MTDIKHTSGPWKFEPHNGFGGEIEGEAFPFGYISTAQTPMPIFELNVILGFEIEELRSYARMMAAAPDMLAALRAAEVSVEQLCIDQHPDNECWNTLRQIRSAITGAQSGTSN